MDRFHKNPSVSEKFTLGPALIPERCTGHFYEQFVVVGVSQERSRNADFTQSNVVTMKPEVLYTNPSESIMDDSIVNFCFPHDVRLRKIDKPYSSPEAQSILFLSLTSLEEPKNSFIFVMTTNTLVYGVCVYVEELHCDVGCIVKPSSSEDASEYQKMKEDMKSGAPGSFITSKKCYCFISRFPFFELHFEILYSLIARDRLFKQSVMDMFNEDSFEREQKITSHEIYQCLSSYYSQKIESQVTHFSLPGEIRSIKFSFPSSDDITSLADWCVSATFRALSLDIVLAFYLSIMLEERIVLISKEPGILSAISLSLIPILRPLVWQGAFIPILPHFMIDCLDVPLPFVIGLKQAPQDRSLKEFIVIDIDNNTISYPTDSLTLADMPKRRDMIANLQDLVQKLNTKKDVESILKTCSRQLEIVKKIVPKFGEYFDLISNIFYEHMMKSGLEFTQNNFFTEIMKVVPNLPRKYRKFAKRFFDTQHFHLYCGTFLEKYKTRREENKLLYQKLQELIAFEYDELSTFETKLKAGKNESIENEIRASKQRIQFLKKKKRELVEKDPKILDSGTTQVVKKQSTFLDVLFSTTKSL